MGTQLGARASSLCRPFFCLTPAPLKNLLFLLSSSLRSVSLEFDISPFSALLQASYYVASIILQHPSASCIVYSIAMRFCSGNRLLFPARLVLQHYPNSLCMARRHRETLQTALIELHAWREAHSSPYAFVLSFADRPRLNLHTAFRPVIQKQSEIFVSCGIRTSDPLLARLACKPLGYTGFYLNVGTKKFSPKKKLIIHSLPAVIVIFYRGFFSLK